MVDGGDGLGQARIGEAHEDAALDKVIFRGSAQQEHQGVLGEVVEGGLAAGVLGEGFGEEQFDGGGELAYGCQRDESS